MSKLEPHQMKAITLYQPWALWVALGYKPIETRTHDRFKNLVGKRIAIHSAQIYDEGAFKLAWEFLPPKLKAPLGVIKLAMSVSLARGSIVCTAIVIKTEWLNEEHSNRALCDCKNVKRFGLFFADVKALKKPIPYKGRQGIFNIPSEVFDE